MTGINGAIVSQKGAERDRSVDVLRALGLVLVILAHTGPPSPLFDIRGFDVVLLVATSGMSFSLSGSSKAWAPYALARVKRLLLPVWLFLSLLFASMLVVPPARKILSPELALASFLMIGGIGYVWIMRVFMTVALIAPVLQWVSNLLKGTSLFLISLIALVFMQGALVEIYGSDAKVSQFGNHGAISVLFQTTGYSLVFLYGMRIFDFRPALVFISAGFWFIIYIAISLTNGDFATQSDKFPPGLHFLSYGLAATSLLFAVRSYLEKFVGLISPLRVAVDFCAANSIWIYLWHIPVALVERKLHIFDGWAVTWMVAIGFATIVVALQSFVVHWFMAQGWMPRAGSKWLKTLLIG